MDTYQRVTNQRPEGHPRMQLLNQGPGKTRQAIPEIHIAQTGYPRIQCEIH